MKKLYFYLIMALLGMSLPLQAEVFGGGTDTSLGSVAIDGILWCGNGCALQSLLNIYPNTFEHAFVTGSTGASLKSIKASLVDSKSNTTTPLSSFTPVDQSATVLCKANQKESQKFECHFSTENNPGLSLQSMIRLDFTAENNTQFSVALSLANAQPGDIIVGYVFSMILVGGLSGDLGVVTNADNDNDGIENKLDNCFWVYNPDQADTDADGIGNLCDSDSDADDIVDDFDGDGIPNSLDNCPTTKNPKQENQDGDIFGDLCDPCPKDGHNGCSTKELVDSDGDDIADIYDNCPNDPNPFQEDADGNGFGNLCDPDFSVNADSKGGGSCSLDSNHTKYMPLSFSGFLLLGLLLGLYRFKILQIL